MMYNILNKQATMGCCASKSSKVLPREPESHAVVPSATQKLLEDLPPHTPSISGKMSGSIEKGVGAALEKPGDAERGSDSMQKKKLNVELEKMRQANLSIASVNSGGPSSLPFKKSQFIASNRGLIDREYKMERKNLGQGSYGSVRRAQNKKTGVLRAVKVIPKKTVSSMVRFQEEISIMKSLTHPNVIKLFESFEDARTIYLVMELCTGGELFDRVIEAGNFTEKTGAHVIKQILNGITYMHSQCVAHRDLKPENFLLSNASDVMDPNNGIKIIDFGLSKKFKPNVLMRTKACTPYYVAPEVLAGKYTEKCDIWSTGVIIYVLLSGTPPFYGNSEDEILDRVTKGKYDFDLPVWGGVSRAAKDLIAKMLVMNFKNRISAEKALRHPWVARCAPEAAPDLSNEDVIKNMRRFVMQNRFKKMALTIIAQELSDEHIRELRDLFMAIDDNHDGTVTVEEMKRAFAKSHLKIPADLAELMAEVDSDGNGSIDYAEFLAGTLSTKQYLQEDVCWAAFRVFDMDGNGSISCEELVQVVTGGEAKRIEDVFGMQKEEIEEILKEVDGNGDGDIDFEEFMNMMRKNTSRILEDAAEEEEDKGGRESKRASVQSMDLKGRKQGEEIRRKKEVDEIRRVKSENKKRLSDEMKSTEKKKKNPAKKNIEKFLMDEK